MSTLLKQLLKQPVVEQSGDMSAIPPQSLDEIRKNIRTGAKDLDQKWANALELVNKAYEVARVQRPIPAMAGGWKQYEEMIQYAVEQLAKTRGLRGDWRMSAAMFTEQEERMSEYTITVHSPIGEQSVVYKFESESAGQSWALSQLPPDIKQAYTIKRSALPDGIKLTFWKGSIKSSWALSITKAP